MTRSGRRNRTVEGESALLRLTRAFGPRCDFCGAGAAAVVLAAGNGSQSATICARCVDRMAAGLGVTPDGGDAA